MSVAGVLKITIMKKYKITYKDIEGNQDELLIESYTMLSALEQFIDDINYLEIFEITLW